MRPPQPTSSQPHATSGLQLLRRGLFWLRVCCTNRWFRSLDLTGRCGHDCFKSIGSTVRERHVGPTAAQGPRHAYSQRMHRLTKNSQNCPITAIGYPISAIACGKQRLGRNIDLLPWEYSPLAKLQRVRVENVEDAEFSEVGERISAELEFATTGPNGVLPLLRWELAQVMSRVRPEDLSDAEIAALLAILMPAHSRVIGGPTGWPGLTLTTA